MIEIVYLVSGLVLPFFYIPQVYKLYTDNTGLASYSLAKCAAQLLLRLPALAFAVFVVKSDYMNVVLTADVLGRVAEFGTAIYSLRRQGVPLRSLFEKVNPLNAMILLLFLFSTAKMRPSLVAFLLDLLESRSGRAIVGCRHLTA